MAFVYIFIKFFCVFMLFSAQLERFSAVVSHMNDLFNFFFTFLIWSWQRWIARPSIFVTFLFSSSSLQFLEDYDIKT